MLPGGSVAFSMAFSIFSKLEKGFENPDKKLLDKHPMKIYLYRNRETVDSEVKMFRALTESPES